MSDTGIRVNSISNTGILIHPARVPVTSNLGILIHQGQVCVNLILVVISIVIPKMYFNVSFIPFFRFWFLVTFGNKVMKIQKYFVIFCLVLLCDQNSFGRSKIVLV